MNSRLASTVSRIKLQPTKVLKALYTDGVAFFPPRDKSSSPQSKTTRMTTEANNISWTTRAWSERPNNSPLKLIEKWKRIADRKLRSVLLYIHVKRTELSIGSIRNNQNGSPPKAISSFARNGHSSFYRTTPFQIFGPKSCDSLLLRPTPNSGCKEVSLLFEKPIYLYPLGDI